MADKSLRISGMTPVSHHRMATHLKEALLVALAFVINLEQQGLTDLEDPRVGVYPEAEQWQFGPIVVVCQYRIQHDDFVMNARTLA